MQKIPYELIEQVANEAINECRKAGFSPRLCVWEMSPSILQTLRDCTHWMTVKDPHLGNGGESYRGIPIREGLFDESTGVRLRAVNQRMQE